ncbi:MAG: hypothetical protein CVU79_05705 [Elusimicrobia bacterium HGW-Elusimicrobia-3]|nr:MAG: hypothetical protein CVU79_05705 [Elusimicrobia bacterium HGW-Elusimicrobia-3]
MLSRAKLTIAAACLLAAAVPVRAVVNAPTVGAVTTSAVTFAWTGGVSPFIGVLSDTNTFAWTISSGPAVSPVTYTSLDANSTYYFQVKSSADTDAGYRSTYTITQLAAPTGLYSVPEYFSAQSSHTAIVTIGWNTNNNHEATIYEVAYNNGGADTVAPYINPLGSPIDIAGLDANTSYNFKVRARGSSGAVTAYTTAITTATPALRLSGLSEQVFQTSAIVSWTPVDSAVPAQDSEGYSLDLSLSPSMSSPVPWTTANSAITSTTLTPLVTNTTYYYRAGTLNISGLANVEATRVFTTLSPAPTGLTRGTVTDGSANFSWTALAPAQVMGYRLEAATGTFSSGETVHSATTYSAAQNSLTIVTLDPNTTYYFRAAGLNTAYVPNYGSQLSSVTLALPISAGFVNVVAEPQAITATFPPLPGSPQAFAAEGYLLQGSTTNFSGGTVYSSATYEYREYQQSLTLTGLSPNNTYYLRLGSLNWQRTPNFSVLGSTRTGFPGNPAGVLLDNVWSSSAAVSFTPGIAAEGHVAEASVYRFFNTVAASSASPSGTISNLVIPGLSPNTTYYFRAGALYNGATVYSNTYPDHQQTLPLALTGLGFAGVFRSSVTVNWLPLLNDSQATSAESYLLQASTSPVFNGALFSSSTLNIGLDRLSITGLSPNTSYYFRAGTFNMEGRVNYAATPATATLPSPPLPGAFGLTPDAMTLTWTSDGNPADTRYLAEIDDNEDFAPVLASSLTAISSATFFGLAPNTTYYTRVTAYNRLGRAIPAVRFPDMATDAYDPSPAAASGIGAYALSANWGPGGNLAGTYYQAAISSNTDFSGTVLSSVTLANTAAFTGLVSNASYYLRVSALNRTGVATDPPIALGTALTWPTTAYALPKAEAFFDMMTDGFSLRWEPNGNSSHTVYYVEASTKADFSVINSSRLINALSCTFSDLAIDTTYWLQIQARGQSGIQSAFADAGSTRTLLSTQGNALALQETTVSLETSYGTISVLLPSGAIGGSTRLTITPSTFTLPGPASAVSQLTPTGIGLVINHFPPTLVLGAITITLPYRIADLPPGIDRSRLVLALHDDVNNIWVPLPSVSDTANNLVVGQTWHLSTFQLMQSNPGTGLAAVKIYPNPYRPNSVSDVMHFANLPAGARVKIYTFLGELVRSLKADVNGMAHWDGANDDGRAAASGVYIAFIRTSDKKSSKSFKVALER